MLAFPSKKQRGIKNSSLWFLLLSLVSNFFFKKNENRKKEKTN